MTYIEIINRFWKIHQFDHFSSAEIAVYFYLLNMANRNMWEDEIAVATAELCASIGMRRSTIIRASEPQGKRADRMPRRCAQLPHAGLPHCHNRNH